MRITIDDIRRHHCARGAKRWFEQHGLDFRRFLKEGIDAEAFIASGDLRARQIVDAKRKEMNDGE
ncbi:MULTISPECIES: thioredoxin domain-containing protein [Halomonas]|uniref:Uncharacterized protein n=1 Tax=Halomonas halophila TaxID=29573 RepID=A0ABQ0TZN0_9GAMM|nr:MULTISPECIES: hypothetical protein [Halomonas]MDR5889625.1 hypothetical protein [Halomonas salina]WJY06307.1 hypothetical protein QWG60_11375 [Halomonas halophila]GEK71606.1 hypothetical protein HHA04nite_01500 [Halomonas halophila]